MRKSTRDDTWRETSTVSINFKPRINTESDVWFSQISFSHQLGTMGDRVAVSRRVISIGPFLGGGGGIPTASGEPTAVFRTLKPESKTAEEMTMAI